MIKIDTKCKHGNSENYSVLSPGKFLKPVSGKIYWNLEEPISSDMDKYRILFAFQQAFLKIQPYINPIIFEPTSDATKAQISLKFRKNGDKDLPELFDNGVLAYAYAPDNESYGLFSDVYINDYYNWQDANKEDGFYLMKVLVHEILHSINLGHSIVKDDILYAIYQPNNEVNITLDTQRGIYNLYKQYGVANPDKQQNAGEKTLSLKSLFANKSDLARLAQYQLNLLGNFLNAGFLNTDKPQTKINKIWAKLSA